MDSIPKSKRTEKQKQLKKRLEKVLERRKKETSTDIIKALKSFAAMAENYRYYNEVESSVLAGQSILNDIQQVALNKDTRQFGNMRQYNKIKEGALKTKELVDYTIKAQLYQQKKDHRRLGENSVQFTDEESKKEYKNAP